MKRIWDINTVLHGIEFIYAHIFVKTGLLTFFLVI
jgi:hypothetical protein